MNTALFVCAALAVITLFLRYRGREKAFRLMREGFTAEATVTSVTHMSLHMSSRWNWVVDARFTYNGKTYRAMSGLLPYKPACKVGETIRVHFLPEKPEYNRILEGDAPPQRMKVWF